MSISPGQRASRRQESNLAASHGGRVMPGSGNQWFAKGDVKTEFELIEAKTTTKASYSLKLAELLKIYQEGLVEGLRPVLVVEFTIRSYRDSYIVLTDSDYQELRRKAGEIE